MTVARASIPPEVENTNNGVKEHVQLPRFFGHMPSVFDSHVSRLMSTKGTVQFKIVTIFN